VPRKPRPATPEQPFTLADAKAAVEVLRANSLPPDADGNYTQAQLSRTVQDRPADSVRFITAPPLSWRQLVWYPDDENLLTRRKLQLWQWMLNPNSYVLLKPAVIDGHSTRRAVLGYTRRGTPQQPERHIHNDDPMQFGDEVPATYMDVGYADIRGIITEHAQLVPNACVLRYVTIPSNVAMYDYLRAPLADSAWDYTCEHPDAPGVRVDGPPALYVADSAPPVAPKRKAQTFDDM
jgi:hypothetical protein